jgi:hypothetical protein
VNQFSADVQHQFPFGIAAEIGYIASRSHHLLSASTATGALLINQVPTPDLSMGSALTQSVPNPFYGKGGAAGIVAGATVAHAQLLMPFPEYGAVTENTNPSHAMYDSMVAKAQKRFTRGLTFLATFTWSKNRDNTWGAAPSNYFNTFAGSTPPTAVQNVYDLNAEWALAAANTPLRFTASWTWDLPFGKGKPFLSGRRLLDYAAGGWHVQGLTIYQCGFPMFIYQTNQNSVIGTGEQRPNATGISPAVPGKPEDKLYNYINKDAFLQAPTFTFGNLSRNIGYRGPGEANWDLSVFKDVSFRERLKVQFRAEALNAFNTVLFANPNTLVNSPNFGRLVYQTNTPREIQLGLRGSF